ncbi:MAG: hypothetical protein ACK5T0_02375 [Vampirovibrionales bacterium]|jgi:hypothetical protein
MPALVQDVCSTSIMLENLPDYSVSALEVAIKARLPHGCTLLRWAIVAQSGTALQVDCSYGTD